MSGRVGKYRAPEGFDPRADLLAKYPDLGDLTEIYAGNDGARVHKWHHYLPLYERYMARWRGKPVRFLEIGVAQGGSQAMWRKYLGPDAIIYGIDIREGCMGLNGLHAQVRIGSQDDPEFLKSVVAEMGGLDLVLDDGSHEMPHIEASLDALFPLMANGGSYMIEDLHTAYWTRWGGGLKNPANFFNSVRSIADDMNHWYHEGEINRPALLDQVAGIHVHDAFVVFDKDVVHEPIHSFVGSTESSRQVARRAAKAANAEAEHD
jgi:hypothetical protein